MPLEDYPVITAPGATAETEARAGELAEILARIYLVPDWPRETAALGPGPGIYVGTLTDYPDPALAAAFGDLALVENREVFATKVEKAEPLNRLRVIGGTSWGVANGVFTLLRDLGFRQYMQGELWAHYPHGSAIGVPVDRTAARPGIKARRIWFGYDVHKEYTKPPPGQQGWIPSPAAQADWDAWQRRNRCVESFWTTPGHNWQSVIIDNQAWFDTIPSGETLPVRYADPPPDWEPADFPGTNPVTDVNRAQPNVGRADVRDVMKQWIRNRFNAAPTFSIAAEMCPFDPNDTTLHDGTAASIAYGTINGEYKFASNQVWKTIIECAQMIAAEYPPNANFPGGRWIGAQGYSNWSDPPSDPASFAGLNVLVAVTRGFNIGAYTFWDLLPLYKAKGAKVGVYQYDSFYGSDFDMPPGRAEMKPAFLAADIKRFGEHDVDTISAEASQNWGLNGRGYYLQASLLWDPDADPDQVLQDFYQGCYGAAAAVMQQYHELIGPETGMTGFALLGQALDLLQQATVLCDGDLERLLRIRFHKAYMHFVRLRQEYYAAAPAAKRETALADIRWISRTRALYICHFAAVQMYWAPQKGADHGLPEELPAYLGGTAENNRWDGLWRGPETSQAYYLPGTEAMPVWRAGDETDNHVGDDEIEDLFQADRLAYPLVPYPSRTFDYATLVVATWDEAVPGTMYVECQSGTRYGIVSTGAALNFQLYAGTSPNKPYPLLIWEVRRATAAGEFLTGDLVQSGTVVQGTGDFAPFTLTLPAGSYSLHLEPNGKGTKLIGPASLPVCFWPETGQRYDIVGEPRFYFYVPVGTAEIAYYCWYETPGLTCNIYNPAGTIVATLVEDGHINLIPVDGQDGKPWSIGQTGYGRVKLMNCPNLFSFNTERVLVPAELAGEVPLL